MTNFLKIVDCGKCYCNLRIFFLCINKTPARRRPLHSTKILLGEDCQCSSRKKSSVVLPGQCGLFSNTNWPPWDSTIIDVFHSCKPNTSQGWEYSLDKSCWCDCSLMFSFNKVFIKEKHKINDRSAQTSYCCSSSSITPGSQTKNYSG